MTAAPEVVLEESELARVVERIGREIAEDHPDGVVLVVILKGALLFAADLARAITGIAVEIEFMAISRFAPDSGRVRILHDVSRDLGGRDVVVVEDVVDTGLTLGYLMSQLRARNPRRLSACALVDRPARRIVPTEVRYRGVEVGHEFLLGFGLHARDRYRNLPIIAAGDRIAVGKDPDLYVGELYGRRSGDSERVVS